MPTNASYYPAFLPRAGAALLLCMMVGLVQAQDTACAIVNTAFKPGEEIVYRISYNWYALWLNAGEVKFNVNKTTFKDRSCYHITGKGYTYKSYDWFYRVRDTYETYLDEKSMLPLCFKRDVDEGGFTFANDVNFDYENNIAEDKVKKKKTAIPDCVQDVLSAIYYARNIDFNQYAPMDTIPIKLYLDEEVFPIYIRYMGKETIETKLGKFRCIKFKPLLIEGTIFSGGENMMVWASDDANKIPIRVESPIIVGSIKADLMSYEGLKGRFSARLE